MSFIKRLSIAAFFALAILAYNNCSNSQFEPLSSLGLNNSASSQCRTKMLEAAKSALVTDASLCEAATNYQCDLRRFRPEPGLDRAQNVECLNIPGMVQACVPVTTYSYNTSLQQQGADPADLAEGGAYNRDEATCINTRITSQKISLIQTEGSTVQQALEQAVTQCRQRSSL
jgi:hypothetical protein